MNEALTQELNARATMTAQRFVVAATDPAMRRQARRDERQLLRDTDGMDEHPEGYEGPCACSECLSYHAED